MARGAAASLVLLAFALRLPGLWTDFWLDEIVALNNVGTVQSAFGIFTSIHHDSNHWLISSWMYVVGQHAAFWMYRVPSLVAGVLTVLVAGQLAAVERSDRNLAMLLVAVSFPLGFYSSEARGYAVAACASLGAVLCLLRWLEQGDRRWLAAHWCVAGIGVLAHLSFVAVLGAEAVFLLVVGLKGRHGSWRLVQPLILPLGVLGLLTVFDLRYLRLGGGPALDVGKLLTEVGALSVGGPIDSVWSPVLAALGLVVVALSIWSRTQRVPTTDGVETSTVSLQWVLYGAVLFTPLAVAVAMRPPFLFPRYFLVSLVFVPTLLASALAGARRPLRLAAVAALLLLNGWSSMAFAGDGRGQYAAALRDMLSAGSGALTVATDHPFRAATVLEFYERRLDSEQRLTLAESDADFFVAGEAATEGPPAWCRGCTLLGEYPSSPLSGASWRVYRRPRESIETSSR